MGNYIGYHVEARLRDKEVTPKFETNITFDPKLGFEEPRKERVMIATEAEMDAAMIKPEDRGYCAHLLIAYKQCAHDCYPFAWRCHHEKHDYLNCKFEDYMFRMKEYEREWRLRQRKQRIEKKRSKEEED